MNTRLSLISMGVLSALALSGCGGGSSESSINPDPVASTPPPSGSVIVGTITGFGSVFINGTKYEVDNNTVVSIEGQSDVSGDDSALEIGMKVKIIATDSNGTKTAKSIEYDDDLKGLIESITPDADNPAIGTIVVLGQTVIINEATAFDDVANSDDNPEVDIRDLQVGMSVEISGYPAEDGFMATYIEHETDDDGNDIDYGNPDDDDDEFELKGTVEAVADDLMSINVNGVVFLIDELTILDDDVVIDAELVGAYVEVEADLVNDEYVARKIELEDMFDDDVDDYDEFEIEGILQAIDTEASPATITINGQTIAVNSVESLEGLVGTMVEIEGTFNDDGVLIIDEVEIESEPNFSVEDTIAEINSDEKTVTTRLGVTIAISDGLGFEDEATDSDENLTADVFFSSLMVGDYIKAKAMNSDNGLSWLKIKRLEQAGDYDMVACEVFGEVAEINGGVDDFTLVIQNIVINSAMVDSDDFEGMDGESVSRTAFFEQLQVGSFVSAESFEGDMYCSLDGLEAESIEFDD